MRLIVGLGNAGLQYAWTPHNLGFLAVDRIAERAGIRVERPEARSLAGFGKYAGQEIKVDGQEYLIMREEEILGVVEGKSGKK